MTTQGPVLPFPTLIDSTMRGAFVSCPHKFYLEFILGYVPKGESINLHAGKCFARGIEAVLRAHYDKKLSPREALYEGMKQLSLEWGTFDLSPQGTNKTFDRMLGALVDYFTEYPLDSDYLVPIETPIGRAVEFSFAFPIDVSHPDTGEPILYAGRADRLAHLNGGILVCADEKTTTQLGASWVNQWRLRGQFTGYVWAGKQMGYDIKGAVIRGIAILKEKYTYAQVLEWRPDWEVNRWYDQLCHDVERMKQCYINRHWDYALDHACADYGGCQFIKVCSSEHEQGWLNVDFQKRTYTPIKAHL